MAGVAGPGAAVHEGAPVTTDGVFLCYRREDPVARVGRLYDRLDARFPGRVFRDVDKVAPAENFVAAIDRALARSRVLVAVIGPRWVVDEQGRRRLDDPDDYVRHEVEKALESPGCRVLPLLAGGTVMPRSEDLPASLAPITTLNALTMGDDQGPYFEFEARQVGDAIADILAQTQQLAPGIAPEPAAPTPVPSEPPVAPGGVAGKPSEALPEPLPEPGPELPPVPPPPSRWRRIVAVAVVALLAAGAVWWLTRPAAVALPDVTDQTAATARQTLEDAGFTNVQPREEPTTEEPPGEVLRTEPAAGTETATDAPVVIVVAAPPEPLTLPDVTDLDRDQADAALGQAGFTNVEFAEKESGDEEAGEVLRTDPPAGTELAASDPITVVVAVALKVPTYEIHDVRGLTQREAFAALEGPLDVFGPSNAPRGRTLEEPSDTVAAGRVIRTEPEIGTRHPAGTNVYMYVSTGPSRPDAACELSTTTYVLSCTGFQAGEDVQLSYGAEPVSTQPASGTGAVDFGVEGFLTAGAAYEFTATGSTSGRSARASGTLPVLTATPLP
jgi:beta-lactam-binding protein with PASTA domain